MCIAGLSMIALLQLLRLLFEHYTIPAYLLFISLIAGSIPTVAAEAKAGVVKPVYAIGTAAAFIGIIRRSDGKIRRGPSGPGTPAQQLSGRLYYPISARLRGITSMMPGMSVSMVLMMLGVYDRCLGAARLRRADRCARSRYALSAGMILFSRVTKYVFRKWCGLGYLIVSDLCAGRWSAFFQGCQKPSRKRFCRLLR